MNKYDALFKNIELDFWIFCQDQITDALMLKSMLGVSKIMTFSTTDNLKDKIIPIPDYNSCFRDDEHSTTDCTFTRCRENAAVAYSDKRCFWAGRILNSFSRKMFFCLADDYPQYLKCIDVRDASRRISLLDMSRYKYLVDLRGYGWTDRLKILLQLGRVVFIEYRPHKEWYFDKLKPNIHYVPIKEDLSDLIDKIEWLEQNPHIYQKIANNMRELANEIFHPEYISNVMKNIILEHGVID